MLNERIKLLRTKKSISQTTLAKTLGVSKQSISNWENDNIMPSIDMLVKIADYFDYLRRLFSGELDYGQGNSPFN